MRWWEGPMLAFDTETTGPDPETALLVSACTTWIRPAEPPAVLATPASRGTGMSPHVKDSGDDPAYHVGHPAAGKVEHGDCPRCGKAVYVSIRAQEWACSDPDCVNAHGDQPGGGLALPISPVYSDQPLFRAEIIANLRVLQEQPARADVAALVASGRSFIGYDGDTICSARYVDGVLVIDTVVHVTEDTPPWPRLLP